MSEAVWVRDPNEHAYVVVWPTPATVPVLQLTLHELPEASGCVHCEEFTLAPTVNVHGAAKAKGEGRGCYLKVRGCCASSNTSGECPETMRRAWLIVRILGHPTAHASCQIHTLTHTHTHLDRTLLTGLSVGRCCMCTRLSAGHW